MPPAFILSQDQTLHEIHSCLITSCNFLFRKRSQFEIATPKGRLLLFVSINLMLASNSYLVYPHLPYNVNPTSLFRWQKRKKYKLMNLGIIRLELMTFTTSKWHSTTELYPSSSLILQFEIFIFKSKKPRPLQPLDVLYNVASLPIWTIMALGIFTQLRLSFPRKYELGF